MLFLLDTDIFAYQATASAETEINWYGDIWSLYMDMREAKDAFKYAVDKVQNRLGEGDLVCCLSCPDGNFRRQIDPSYKSNRKGTRKPVGYAAFIDWVKDNYTTVQKPFLEADDVMGLLQTRTGNIGHTTIISNDKDMRGVPGRLYRPMSDELMEISTAEADAFFLTQVLTGDQTDGIPGLRGCGPKTAEKILGKRPHWGAVEKAYTDAGHTRDDALTQARLVRILRWSDWSETEERPRLWTP